ncbi:alpha/beta hydrolase [Dyadobacter sp. LHD-138]|uniref:alpha/beta hydrolase n=1 Tax=Dyadobacter sp. LHD-138 TaxID=3071413 RepID=UPI0027DF5316|nr:alpha/beta hydrolase [Dyadobacter sp. LHD-138]MDQ6477449.1 alpha/beta hydrolase [Dyadobacter sp. LHD-138]
MTLSKSFAQGADTLSIPGAKLIKNIRYGTANIRQTFDLYIPENASKPVPVIVWIHGGGWNNGTKKNMHVDGLVAHGYAIASVDYRFTRDTIFPAQIRDCNAAIALLWKNASQYHLDTSRFILAGASAGGHLAALIGMSNNNNRQEFYPFSIKNNPVRFQAVINYYGVTDLYVLHGNGLSFDVDADDSIISKLLGASSLKRPDLAKWASATTYIDKNDPPTLTIHGAKDQTSPLWLGQLFTNLLQVTGVKNDILILPEAAHAGSVFSQANVLEKVLSFLKEVAGNKRIN